MCWAVLLLGTVMGKMFDRWGAFLAAQTDRLPLRTSLALRWRTTTHNACAVPLGVCCSVANVVAS